MFPVKHKGERDGYVGAIPMTLPEYFERFVKTHFADKYHDRVLSELLDYASSADISQLDLLVLLCRKLSEFFPLRRTCQESQRDRRRRPLHSQGQQPYRHRVLAIREKHVGMLA